MGDVTPRVDLEQRLAVDESDTRGAFFLNFLGTPRCALTTHGDAAAGQDPRSRSRNSAQRRQPQDKAVLQSAAFSVFKLLNDSDIPITSS
jgi:hypothetical protein